MLPDSGGLELLSREPSAAYPQCFSTRDAPLWRARKALWFAGFRSAGWWLASRRTQMSDMNMCNRNLIGVLE